MNDGWSLALYAALMTTIVAALWNENVWKRVAVYSIVFFLVLGLRLIAYAEGIHDGKCLILNSC